MFQRRAVYGGMNVGDLVRAAAVTIESEASVVDVSKLMSAYRIGLLVVLDPLDRARIVGVLSEHDIVTAVAKGGNIYSPWRTL